MELPVARVLTSTALVLARRTSWIHRRSYYLAVILVLTMASMHLVQAQIVFTVPSEFLGEYPPLETIDKVANSYFWRAPDGTVNTVGRVPVKAESRRGQSKQSMFLYETYRNRGKHYGVTGSRSLDVHGLGFGQDNFLDPPKA